MIHIRLATSSDAAFVREVMRPMIENTAITFETHCGSVAHFEEKIASISKDFPFYIAQDSDGNPMGFAYAAKHRVRQAYQWCAEPSVYVHPKHRGKSVAKALYEQLFETLKKQNIHVLYAGITVPNTASEKLHQSMGFQAPICYSKVGYKMGHWHDVCWWQKELLPRNIEPKAFIPFSTL